MNDFPLWTLPPRLTPLQSRVLSSPSKPTIGQLLFESLLYATFMLSYTLWVCDLGLGSFRVCLPLQKMLALLAKRLTYADS